MRVLVVVALCLVVVMVVVNAGDSSGDKRKKSIKNVSSRQGDKVKKFKTRDEGRRRSPGEVKTLNSRIAEKRSKKHKKRKSSKKTASHQGKKIKKSHHTQGKEAIKKRVLKKTKKGCAGRCVANTRCGKESVIEGKCQDGFQCCISNKRRRKSGAKKVSCLLLQHCNKLRGQCQKKKIGCHDDQMMYKNSKTKKYCSGSCVCCVSAPETCPSNSKCNKKKGVCVSDRNDCNGIVKKGRELCGSSSCVCCKSKGFSCKTKQQCLVLKGVCQPASHTCSGNMLLGSTYCSESDCGCCVTNIVAPWGYEGSTGPAYWALTYPQCGGSRQSPINIVTSQVVGNYAWLPLGFINYEMVPSSMTIRNTGHTAEVTLQQTLMPTLMGGDLLAPYTFAQFHFHWGSPSTLGSEHTIDGKKYAAELHVVHYKTAYGNVSAASSYSDGLTVLAMLIQIGEDDNLRLQSVIDGLATIHEAGTTNHIVPFPLRELLPENVENFYSYLGSLTIPPCSEAVIWTIFKEPITMSMNQMSQFFKLLTEENTPLVDTFRPLQPLGNRTVYDGSMTPLWGYEGLIGPQYWPKYFPLCGGSAQSPVNIVTKTVQPVYQLPFVFTNFDATPLTATLENNGHAADVSITMAPGVAIPSLSGGGLTDQYTFAQLHFHWGRNQDEGSEHTINGGRYPGELHIVTYKTQYSTLTQALNYNDGVVVLGIFLKAAPEDNNVLSPIIAGLPRVLNADTTTTIPSFPLQNLLPGNIINYYRYQGSLTTPTCNQVVSWTVFAQPIPISLAQLAAFRTLHDETGQLIEFNFRPVQPLNGRTVFMTKG